MLQPDQLINGKYRIVRLIGDGGMGSVYEARHEVLGTHVALKFLHPEIAKQPGLQRRFLQEAQVSATVRSPHICRVSDVDTAEEGAYLVMDLLRGEPLQTLLDRQGRLDIQQAIGLTMQVLTGLQVAHSRGVVHRDLKPDNVFLVPGPTGSNVVLLDFGIAKLRHTAEYQMTLTRPGAVMGTPEYMAPEQAYSADLVDQRSDLFSVGVMLFEMLAGQRPVDGDNPQQIAEKIITGKIRRLEQLRPDLPAPLAEIVHRAIEGDPDKRWSSADELASTLRPYMPGTLSPQSSSNVTGASTPFVPVSKTPVVSAEHWQDAGGSVPSPGVPTHADSKSANRAASVPATLPPTNDAPPESLLANGQANKTASMPATSFPPPRGASPTVNYGRGAAASIPSPPGAPRPRRAATGWWWLSLLFLLLGAGAGGAVYYQKELRPSAPRPPAPLTLKTTSPKQQAAEFEVPADFFETDSEYQPLPVSRPRSSKAEPPAGPGKSPPAGFPPIALPTSLPPITLPTSFPTTFPTTFPTAFPFPIPRP